MAAMVDLQVKPALHLRLVMAAVGEVQATVRLYQVAMALQVVYFSPSQPL
jgi:hypothetical protein